MFFTARFTKERTKVTRSFYRKVHKEFLPQGSQCFLSQGSQRKGLSSQCFFTKRFTKVFTMITNDNAKNNGGFSLN